jgi:hypothetical protein
MRSSCCQLTQLCSLNKDIIIIIPLAPHPPEMFGLCAPDKIPQLPTISYKYSEKHAQTRMHPQSLPRTSYSKTSYTACRITYREGKITSVKHMQSRSVDRMCQQ